MSGLSVIDNVVPFDISNGQKIAYAQNAIRSNEFDRSNYRLIVSHCGHLANALKVQRDWEHASLEAHCCGLLVKLDAALAYPNLWGSVPEISLSKKNLEVLQSPATITALVRELRNGLAHPIDGNALPNIRARLNGSAAIPFYVLYGREFGLEYPEQSSAEELKNDLSFGCGHHRISMTAQVAPLIEKLKELPSEIAELPSKSVTMKMAIRVTGL